MSDENREKLVEIKSYLAVLSPRVFYGCNRQRGINISSKKEIDITITFSRILTKFEE